MNRWKKLYTRVFPASKYQASRYQAYLCQKQERLEQALYEQVLECRKLSSELKEIKEAVHALQTQGGGQKKVFQQYLAAEKRKTPIVLLNFVYHLADHCNLNCKCCDHFSPIAKEKFADLASFEQDIKRLGELCGGYARRINLQGGEPLLHPNAAAFAIAARNHFPVGQILFTTNGILLPKQEDRFWRVCAEYGIEIEITKYPIGLPYQEIKEKADAFGVVCRFYGSTQREQKCTYLIPLDLSGEQDICSNFNACSHANECIMLKDGRMYTCTVAPNIEHFNNYFGADLYLSEKDSIDIYQAQTITQITDFLAKPIPFCRYCNVAGRRYGIEWGQSKRDLSEWT
ncbi:MAG: radical SAM protein [Eubacterium sp.]|nr:radical SAM protein [Eubacterium sp.]